MNKTHAEVTVNPLAGRVNADAHTMLYSGNKFFYTAVSDHDIIITDIAHHLARMGRWLGAMTVEHYSVAEHSWLMADYLYRSGGWLSNMQRALVALGALMHDSEEYVTGDFPSPLKILVPELAVYGDYLRGRIFNKFNIPMWTYPIVKPFDYRIRKTEAVFVRNGHKLFPETEALVVDLKFWPPREAEFKFLTMYDNLVLEIKDNC